MFCCMYIAQSSKHTHLIELELRDCRVWDPDCLELTHKLSLDSHVLEERDKHHLGCSS